MRHPTGHYTCKQKLVPRLDLRKHESSENSTTVQYSFFLHCSDVTFTSFHLQIHNFAGRVCFLFILISSSRKDEKMGSPGNKVGKICTYPHSSWDLLEHRCTMCEIILRPSRSLTSCNLELKVNIIMYKLRVRTLLIIFSLKLVKNRKENTWEEGEEIREVRMKWGKGRVEKRWGGENRGETERRGEERRKKERRWKEAKRQRK